MGPAGRGIPVRARTFDDDAAFGRLAETLEKLDAERGTGVNHVFHPLIPPSAFPVVCEQLSKSGLAEKPPGCWIRVVIEKRFTNDLASAEALNGRGEQRLPRVVGVRHRPLPGHGDGAEHPGPAVREPVVRPDLERHYVGHVQITTAEDIGLGGRAGYYDGIGAARDVIENHLIQLLAPTAMEEPVSFHP